MRRLPVYLLLDTSGSMNGEPIQAVNVGLQSLLSSLRSDPHALDTVYISIITFDTDVREFLPLTELADVQLVDLPTPKGATHLGEALEMVSNKVKKEIKLSTADQKGDWAPLLFIMTDGKPSDLLKYKEMASKIRNENFGSIIACGAGPKAKEEYLKLVTDNITMLDHMDSASFESYFKWVSEVVNKGSKSAGVSEELELPPAPRELNIVI